MKNNGKKEGEKLLLEGILNLEMLCMPYERFTYNDLPVMERTGRRMFLQLYRERMEQDGARAVVERTISLLREERRSWQKRMQCVQKVREKERLLALKERVREDTEQPPFLE